MKKNMLILLLLIGSTACASKHALRRDQSMIDQAMLSHEAEIEACYTSQKEQRSDLSGGIITIRAEHGVDGKFYELRQLKGFVGSGPVYDCIAEVVASWKTEAPYTRGPVDLSWNFEHRDQLGEGLAASEISKVLARHQDDFDSCFSQLHAQKPEIKGGDIKFDIGIRPNGQIKDLRLVEGFKGSDEVFRCIEEQASQWVFPSSASDSQARWEWSFRTVPSRKNTETSL